MNKVLIIDDEPQLRNLLSRMMELEGYQISQAADCRSALRQVKTQLPDVVLCDVRLPDGNGVDLIPQIKQAHPLAEIVMLTAHGNIPDGVQAIKHGAFDYITKGDDNNKIIPLIARAMQQAASNQSNKKSYDFGSILGTSKAIQEAIELARKVSTTDVAVLLTGETGTGKEVFAQAIHHNSHRAGAAFVAINCSSFSKDLLESEMFGYKAGAFTGALKDKRGLFEEANRGTIFLDEIGEMDIALQAKLLRILETGEQIKIGDTKPTKLDVRIIAATNRDLAKEIANGNFREDLFYRLSVFQISLPALRNHAEDLAPIALHFVSAFCTRQHRVVPTLTPEFIAALEAYQWKGNVRELRNAIERSLIISNEKELTVKDLPIEIQHARLTHTTDSEQSSLELASMERYHIRRVLEHTKGNKTETARLLKIGLTTLYRKIEEYGL